MQRSGADWISVTEEFGTLKGTKVFQLLRAENALTTSVTNANTDDVRRVHTALSKSLERKKVFDAFCPADLKWREFVVKRGRIVFNQALEHLQKGEIDHDE